jgi:pimeloyl-ACP methyl ester carboxylesterase
MTSDMMLIHLKYLFVQFWRTYIKRPMVLVGPSLGAAVAIDFAVNYPEAVPSCYDLLYYFLSVS